MSNAGPSYALLFATRSEPNGPLRPLGGLCDIGANTNVALDIVRARFGAGYLPQPGHKENQFNQSFVHWPLLFGFLFLAIGCVLVNELIKIVAKDKWHQK
jgi:hypothetical protein